MPFLLFSDISLKLWMPVGLMQRSMKPPLTVYKNYMLFAIFKKFDISSAQLLWPAPPLSYTEKM